MYADDLVLLTTNELHLESALAPPLPTNTHTLLLQPFPLPSSPPVDNIQPFPPPMRLRDGQVLEFVIAFKYLGSFVQNDASQDKELNRRIDWVSGNGFR